MGFSSLITLLFAVFFLASAQAAAPSSNPAEAQANDEALCGPRGTPSPPNSLSAIEKNMPPVHHQSSSNWCYAFHSCDLLNYNLQLKRLKTDPFAHYSESNQISVVDSVATEKLMLDQNATPLPEFPGRINLDEPGQNINLLSALQNRGVVKSEEQVNFTPLQGTQALDRLLETMNSLSGTPSTACSPTSLPLPSQSHPNFANINFILAKAAQTAGDLKSDGQFIDHYSEIAGLGEKPTLALPPFIPHTMSVSSPQLYLQQLRKVLEMKQPAIASVCENELFHTGEAGCQAHGLTVVGAAYSHGQCMVRLRNSLGPGWMNHGYVTLTLKHFLEHAKTQSTYHLDWVEPALKNESKHCVATLDTPGSSGPQNFVGVLKNTRTTSRFQNGVSTLPDGREVHFKDGQLSP